MREPIDVGGKVDEAEEGHGEFVVAGRDATVGFDAAEEVFDLVAAPVIAAMETVRLPAVPFRRDAAPAALPPQPLAEFIGVETFIGDDPRATRAPKQRHDGVLVILRTGREADGDRSPVGVHHRRQPGIQFPLVEEKTYGVMN